MESIFNLYWALRVLRYAMPILANSPSVFQSFMNDIFRDMLDRRVFVYIDDCNKVRKEGRKQTGLAREDSGEFYLQIT